MKKDSTPNGPTEEKTPDSPENSSNIDRRKFIKVAGAGALAFSIVPRFVLGKGYVAPSDKLTLAYVGCGTQGMREMLPMLAVPDIQIVAICDPNQYAVGYKDWDKNGLRNSISKAINKPDWQPGGENVIPGGREVGKNVVDSFYANVRGSDNFKACTAYADYRELLDKEKDLDAVKIMTPDHLHGLFAIAALKRNKHVLMHKPVSNRLLEGKAVIELARSKPNIVTHLVPWDSNGSMDQVMAWINDGKIGKLREVHNWTNRPVWPQYPMIPTENVPVPDGLDWQLWLGPEADRQYSPHYTNMVFRGWYDFGGGSMADMGHYSLWTVFNALQLTSPEVVVPNLTHYVGMGDYGPTFVRNDFSFPEGCTVKFKYPANGDRPPVDLFWWDGGIRPTVPEELIAINEDDLPAEGMMFVGAKGKILTGFNIQNPRLFSKKKKEVKAPTPPENSYENSKMINALTLFAKSCKAGTQYPGSFPEAEGLTEAVNLYAASLRAQKLLKYDATSRQITNNADANKYLKRDYRTGWDPATI
ncbi:MAG TPA: Gfo/Idh/MocA family oxidoreductase [Mucilaginibacter sp.]|nr:Gfo/Idh/MocA family oxidoreductase [Mucilaginibacter sp.]